MSGGSVEDGEPTFWVLFGPNALFVLIFVLAISRRRTRHPGILFFSNIYFIRVYMSVFLPCDHGLDFLHE